MLDEGQKMSGFLLLLFDYPLVASSFYFKFPYSSLVPNVPNISKFIISKNSVAPVSDFVISVDIDDRAAWLFKCLECEPGGGLSLSVPL
jgi:hypothetical protein